MAGPVAGKLTLAIPLPYSDAFPRPSPAMKPAHLALTATAVLLATFSGASAYTAWRSHQQLDKLNQAMVQYPLLKVISRSKTYSLWQSEETVSYQLGCDNEINSELFGGTRPGITVRNTVSHNPFSPGVRTDIIWPANWAEPIKQLFGDAQPLSIHTRAGWLGQMETRISSPGFRVEKNGNMLHWKGLEATFQYDLALQNLQHELVLRGSDASDAQGRFKLSTQDLQHKGQYQRSSSGLLLGQETLRFGGVQLAASQGDTPHSFSAGVLETSMQSSEQGGMVALSGKGSWVGLHYNSKPLGDLSGQASLSRLDAKALADYNKQALTQGVLQCHFDSQLANPANRALLARILSHSPAFAQAIALANPEGNSTLNIKASLSAPSEGELAGNDAALAKKLALQTLISWPQILPERWINDFAPEAQRDALVQSYRSMVSQMLAAGSLQQAGALLQTRFELANGKLLQNGKPYQPQRGPALAASEPAAEPIDPAIPVSPDEALSQ